MFECVIAIKITVRGIIIARAFVIILEACSLVVNSSSKLLISSLLLIFNKYVLIKGKCMYLIYSFWQNTSQEKLLCSVPFLKFSILTTSEFCLFFLIIIYIIITAAKATPTIIKSINKKLLLAESSVAFIEIFTSCYLYLVSHLSVFLLSFALVIYHLCNLYFIFCFSILKKFQFILSPLSLSFIPHLSKTNFLKPNESASSIFITISCIFLSEILFVRTKLPS